MIAPTGQRLSFAGESARAFALDFCFFEICDAVIRERRFAADRRQLIFTSLVSFNCKCLFGLVQRPYWLIIVILECETPGRLSAVARVDPKLRVVAIVSNIEAGDSAIARVARGNKVPPMITVGGRTRHGDCAGTGVSNGAACLALQKRSICNSSTNPSTNASYVSSLMCKSLAINEPGWRNWQTRQT